jgi:hypothetical protein
MAVKGRFSKVTPYSHLKTHFPLISSLKLKQNDGVSFANKMAANLSFTKSTPCSLENLHSVDFSHKLNSEVS